MSSTDDRIVKMQFDNAEFKRRAAETKTALADVNGSMDAAGKNKGLLNLDSNMGRVAASASKMSIIATTALATITNKAVNAGLAVAKSFTVAPVMQGFDEYELKMKSIQTILANTKGENLKSVSSALQELNTYSDKTIYNFASMTENIGTMTTAGINLDTATATVKGFSNMVALAGGDAYAASGALVQFSQGLQSGVLRAMDWQSLAVRGLGSQALQKSFFETARAAGTLKDIPLTTTFEEWTKANGGFKGSLESGWLTTDVATKALGIMTGDVKNVQQLMKMGFDKKTANDMLKIADSAMESATKVRTFSAFMDTLKESIGSGWGQIFETVVGDFNESTNLFTTMSTVVGGAVGKIFGYINRTLKGWDALGGRMALLQTFKNLLAPIGAIIQVISAAWKEAFPARDAGSGLASATKGLEKMTSPLQTLADMIRGSAPIVTTFFKSFGIGIAVLKGAGKLVTDFVGNLLGLVEIKAPSSGGFLGFIRDLARAIKNAVDDVSDLLQKGQSLTQAFGNVKIKMPSMPNLPSLPSMPSLSGITGGDTSGLSSMGSGIKDLTGKIFGLKDASEETSKSPVFMKSGLDTGWVSGASNRFTTMASSLKNAGGEGETMGQKFGGTLKDIGGKIADFFKGVSFEDIVSAFNLAILGTFMITLTKMFNQFAKVANGFGNALGGFGELFGSMGESMTTFAEAQKRAATAKLILSLALAIGILAVSMWLLSTIPADKMKKAFLGLTGLALIMVFVMKQIGKVVEDLEGKGTNLKLIALSVALVALGVALVLLAAAFMIMDHVSLTGVAKGLVTIWVVMTAFQKLGGLAEKAYKNILGAAAAMAIVAVSLIVLAGALLLFKLVDWDSMGKAGAALGGLTLAVGLLAAIPYAGIAKVGLALLAASVGMLAMANALILFGLVKWESIGKAAVVLGLLTIALAALMFVGNPVTISGVVGLGFAMILLAGAMMILNNVEWASIAKIAVILGVLLVAFSLLLVVLAIAAPIIPILGLFAIALLALGAALFLFSAGLTLAMALAAAGTAAFAALATGAAVAVAVFMQTLASEAPLLKNSFLKILQTLIDTIVEAVPMVIDGIKRLWDAVKKEFSSPDKGQSIAKSGESWMDKLKQKIADKIPSLVEKAKDLAMRFLNGLKDKAGAIAAWGVEMVVNIIDGVRSKVGALAKAAVDLIVGFTTAIGLQAVRIANAGFKLIIDLINALSNAIRTNGPALGKAMGGLGVAMIQGLIGGIWSMFSSATSAIGSLAQGMVDRAKSILKIFSPSRVFRDIGQFLVAGLTGGIQDNAVSAITAVASMVSGQIAVASQYISGFIQKLDQQSLAASAKAEGLAAAAKKAAAAAEKSKKNKKDDRSAKKLQNAADAASKQADTAAAQADAAKAAQDRADEFAKADLLTRAQMRSEDAANQIDSAKQAEKNAAAALIQADALDKQAKAKGVSKGDAKKFKKQADDLRKQAAVIAGQANALLEAARGSAADALTYQTRAGDEASAQFQKEYEDAQKSDALEEQFQKMTDSDKAKLRREQAAALQAQADADLAAAKRLAYTDLEGANALAQQALDEADKARQMVDEAKQYEASTTPTSTTTQDLSPTDAAAAAFNEYAALYDASYAAAAGTRTVEFNQYNTSPEALSPAEVYRQTHNLVDYAANNLQPV